MLKYHQDFVFFVDPFKFALHENLERTDIRNRSFILCTSNVRLLLQDSLLRNIVLRSLLHNLTSQI